MQALAWWLALVALLVVLTSIYGGLHFYSPVPYWDQWRGQFGFYQTFDQHPFAALWAQHNEHRIVFSRLLFLLDRALFDGDNAPLIFINYLLALGTAAAFVAEYLRNGDRRLPQMLVVALIFGMLMLWTQQENFAWGFQSGSLGVNLFAIWAFALFARGYLTAALVLGFAATLTMGNGIAVFGSLALIAMLQRSGWQKLVVIIASGVVAYLVYFHGYEKPTPGADPTAVQVALAEPKFFLILLGGPLVPLTHGLRAAMAVGFASLLAFLLAATQTIVTRNMTSYRAFLIASYCFIAVSALGAAHLRWMYGLIGATASRYTTPALVGLVAVILLLLDVTRFRVARAMTVLSAALFTVLAGYQHAAFASNDKLYFRKLAVLSEKVDMDLPEDESLISPPHLHRVFVDGASYASRHLLGVYRFEWMRVAGQQVDPNNSVSNCRGKVETAVTTFGTGVVSGWVSADTADDQLIAIRNASGRTVGWGVTGMGLRKLDTMVSEASGRTGWQAVADLGTGPLSAYIYSNGKWCQFGTP